ncbi:hypothetical protein T06_15108 [Trichinella sp. T6]|nr:hypothetical protein T06_15108 [Trichinella sp. T6]
MQDVRKSIICLKNLENGANSFNGLDYVTLIIVT